MTADDWLKVWWLPLLVTVVGGLILAGIISIFSKTVRDKFWKPIGRALRSLFTLRVTTTKRQAERATELAGLREQAELSTKRFQEVCDALDVTPVLADSTLVPERIQQLQRASDDAWAHAKAEVARAEAHAQSQIHATQALAQTQMGEALRIHEGQIELARDTSFKDGYAAGRAEAMAEVQAQRAVPPLQPVWRIDDPGPGGNRFVLRNMQDGVEISDVSVEVDTSEFMFSGPTQTRGPFEGSLTFLGSKSHHGSLFGVDFTVRWRDGNGDTCAGVVKVDRDPRRAVIL